MSNRSEETPSTEKVPPRLPPRVHRATKLSPSIEQEVPISSETILNRRPPPPPPPPITNKSTKTRSSRKSSRSNSIIDVQQRSSSVLGPRTSPIITSNTKNLALKEQHLLKRSSSADRIGRERWLHHITDSFAINNGS